MNKTIIIVLAILIIVALAWYWLTNNSRVDYNSSAETPETGVSDDTTQAINSDLQGINLSDLDQEFQSIDTDLKSL